MAKEKTSRWTESWLPVKSIKDNCIILNNGYKVTGVKITPNNIFILEYEQQLRVVNNLKDFYNQVDYEFWLIVTDRPVDISVYQSRLQLLYNQSTNSAIRKLINEDIQKAEDFINNDVMDTEYYILFRHKDDTIIQKRIRELIESLSNCGLISSQTSNDDLRMLLDNFYNGGESTEFRTVAVR